MRLNHLSNPAIFGYQCIVTLTFDLLIRKSLGHNLHSSEDYVKFYDDRCKRKAFIRLNHFT